MDEKDLERMLEEGIINGLWLIERKPQKEENGEVKDNGRQ